MLCGTRYAGTSGQEAERHPGRRRFASASGAPRSSIAGGGISELPTRLGLGRNNSANGGCRAGVGAYFAGDVGGGSRGTHASDPYAFPDTTANALRTHAPDSYAFPDPAANALIQCRGSRGGTGPADAQQPLPEGIPGEARRSLLRLIGAARWAETRLKLTSPTEQPSPLPRSLVLLFALRLRWLVGDWDVLHRRPPRRRLGIVAHQVMDLGGNLVRHG